MSLRDVCSLKDTTILRNLILENPDLPIICFCGEESWRGEYGYEQSDVSSGSVKELTLYEDQWLDRDDYQEELAEDMADKEECKHLSDKDFWSLVDKKVKETEFVKAITIYIG